MMGVEMIKNERFKGKNRGVEFRYITEITRDNIPYCKELSKIAEIRHLNGVRGNFEVSQRSGKGEYIGTAILQEAEPVAQLIYSNVKEIVEQQQFVFDTLWIKAIPSQVRIKEIEEGIKPETIEVIVDPKTALETEYRLLKSAKQEIRMIFSAVNTFHMQERQLGLTKILTNLSNRGVNIKILTPVDDQVRELIADLKEQAEVKKLQEQKLYQKNNDIDNVGNNNSVVDIQDIAPSSSINAKIIVVDNQDSLAMEIKDGMTDGMTDSIHDTIGLSTLSNSKSTIASYSAIFENLSKQNQLYKQLKDAFLTVEHTNAIQREFINVAAHELRTPVQPILGYAELLLEEETSDDKKQALMGIIHNSERLQKLASDILDVARMDSNTFQLYKEPINLNYVMSNIVKDYTKREEQKKAIDIAKLIPDLNHGNNKDKEKDNDSSKKRDIKLFFESKVNEDIFVDADKERLTQVICNLLDNAFKFTEGHGESIQIALEEQKLHQELLAEQRLQQQQEQQQPGNYAIIGIKDTGTGIDPEISPRLFSKFATKSHKGTGLGLYISKNIIEAHGGRLYATNNYDKGATFTITLPLVRKQN